MSDVCAQLVQDVHGRLRARLPSGKHPLGGMFQAVLERPQQLGPTQPWTIAVSVCAFCGLLGEPATESDNLEVISVCP